MLGDRGSNPSPAGNFFSLNSIYDLQMASEPNFGIKITTLRDKGWESWMRNVKCNGNIYVIFCGMITGDLVAQDSNIYIKGYDEWVFTSQTNKKDAQDDIKRRTNKGRSGISMYIVFYKSRKKSVASSSQGSHTGHNTGVIKVENVHKPVNYLMGNSSFNCLDKLHWRLTLWSILRNEKIWNLLTLQYDQLYNRCSSEPLILSKLHSSIHIHH